MESKWWEVIFNDDYVLIWDFKIKSKKTIKLLKKYKTFNTIRRNFRKISTNIEKIIKFQNNEIIIDIEMLEPLFLEVIILYSRFFLSTKWKTRLKANDFFRNLDLHNEIISLRNKYFAHNECDILWWDKIKILDNKIESFYEYNLILSKEKNLIFLENIKKIHNKIDLEIILLGKKILENLK